MNEGKSRRGKRASHDSGFVFQLLNLIFVIVFLLESLA